MPERLPLNSQSLQKRFPEVYRDLFENYPIVTSSAIHIALTVSMRKLSGPMIWQKLPFRLYVGFSPGGNTFEIKEVHFDAKNNCFKEERFDNLDWKKFSKVYPSWTESKYPICGGKIILLWEVDHAHGFSSGKYLHFAALPQLLKGGNIFEVLHHGTSEQNASDILKVPEFKSVFLDAWELIVGLSRRGFSTNSLAFASLVSSSYPIATFSAPINDVHAIATAPFSAFSVTDLMTPIPLGVTFDMACIFPGHASFRGSFIAHYENEMRKRYDSVENYIRTLGVRTGAMEDILQSKRSESGYDNDVSSFSFHTFELLEILTRFFKSGDSGDFSELCRALDQLRWIKAVLEGKTSAAARNVLAALHREGDASVCPLGVGHNEADVLVIAYIDRYRGQIKQLLESHPEYALEYASWVDGWGEEGFKVQQCLPHGIKATSLGTDTVKLAIWSGKGTETRYTKYGEIKQDICDLLLDAVENKVWVRGQPTTSKELPSQKGIVELLAFLLKRKGETISNGELHESPYKHYRNELQSKLVGPLEKVLLHRTKKKLGMKVRGGLTHFTLQFDPEGLVVGLVEKA